MQNVNGRVAGVFDQQKEGNRVSCILMLLPDRLQSISLLMQSLAIGTVKKP